MPDAGALARGIDIPVPARTEGIPQVPVVVFDDGAVRVTAVAVTHGPPMRNGQCGPARA